MPTSSCAPVLLLTLSYGVIFLHVKTLLWRGSHRGAYVCPEVQARASRASRGIVRAQRGRDRDDRGDRGEHSDRGDRGEGGRGEHRGSRGRASRENVTEYRRGELRGRGEVFSKSER